MTEDSVPAVPRSRYNRGMSIHTDPDGFNDEPGLTPIFEAFHTVASGAHKSITIRVDPKLIRSPSHRHALELRLAKLSEMLKTDANLVTFEPESDWAAIKIFRHV
jgi:hypothetical protein